MQNRNVLEWALIAYLTLTWVAMAPMNIGEWSFILILIYLIRKGRAQWKGMWEKSYLYPALGLFAACLISLAGFGFWPLEFQGQHPPFQPAQNFLKLLYLFLPIPLCIGLSNLSSERWSAFFRTGSKIFIGFNLLSIQQFFTGWPIQQGIPGLDGYYHSVGLLGHHLSLASIWIFPSFLFLDLYLSSYHRGKKISGIAAVLGFITIFLSFSRMAWAATVLGLLMYGVFKIKSLKWRTGFVLGGLILALGAYQLPSVQNRIHSRLGVQDRFEIWGVHRRMFEMRPWTGVGFRQSEAYSSLLLTSENPGKEVFSGHAHNNFLEILSGTGVLGALAWLVWSLWVLVHFWKNTRVPGVLGLFAAWIVFHLNGLTQVNFWEGKVLHQMMWAVAIGMVLIRRRASA